MPPEIEIESQSEWTINGQPRNKGKPECQIIMTDPQACATCPLAEKEPEEPPSAFIQHLVHLEGLILVGAHFNYADLSTREWTGLKLLKLKRDERSMAEMKKQRQPKL